MLEVIVSGESGSGKSVVMDIIIKALTDAGFNVDAYSYEKMCRRSPEQQQVVLKSIQERSPSIVVTEHQRRRLGVSLTTMSDISLVAKFGSTKFEEAPNV